MLKKFIKKQPVDKWVIDPMKRFISNSTMSGIVLFASALLAMIIANSPLADYYFDFWHITFSIGFEPYVISKDLHHWINDGLMAVFFFVVGLELKREIIGGELQNPANAVLPIAAAIGGMVLPALIYYAFNYSEASSGGWGIPMATDIAFALDVLYLLGDRVPLSLKIFLTVLAIADDLGAVLVVAFFYTSNINEVSLLTGALFLGVLIFANYIGVRSTLFYGIVGIGGLWTAFLMSGVHATIAAVLAAFTIPADVKISAKYYSDRLKDLIWKFQSAETNEVPTVTNEQFHVLAQIQDVTKNALTPLQRLEHALHPLVAFIIMPVFAFSNAGVVLSADYLTQMVSPVALGVSAGLLVGKVLGVVGVVRLFTWFKWGTLPEGMNNHLLWGAGFLAAIGFTMSLFITGLAFRDDTFVLQSKLGILTASFIASVIGFLIIRMGTTPVSEADSGAA